MLTQQELDRDFMDAPAAAKVLEITNTQVRFLCSRGRLEGAMKLGTSGWIIPRISVLNYKPQKRGPKSKTLTKVEYEKIRSQALQALKEQNASV